MTVVLCSESLNKEFENQSCGKKNENQSCGVFPFGSLRSPERALSTETKVESGTFVTLSNGGKCLRAVSGLAGGGRHWELRVRVGVRDDDAGMAMKQWVSKCCMSEFTGIAAIFKYPSTETPKSDSSPMTNYQPNRVAPLINGPAQLRQVSLEEADVRAFVRMGCWESLLAGLALFSALLGSFLTSFSAF